MNQKTAIKQLNALSKEGKSMRLAAEDWKNDYQILVSTILSARTRDEVTIPVAEKLFKKYPTAKKLVEARLKNVQLIIKPVNFYKNKSKSIINCSKILVVKYNSKVPHDIDKLIELPGVGRKTANVFLAEHGKDAIGVDTHLSYISQKLGWTENKDPHKIERDLENLFPKKLWKNLNSITVRFGKTYTSRKEKDRLLDEIRGIK